MGQEITIQLALRAKPAAFSATDPSRGIIPEMLVEALNAVRIHGHSQILIFCNSTCTTDTWDKNNDEVDLATVIAIVEAMQFEDEEIEIVVTPGSVEERRGGRFCCINLRLKK